MPLNINQSGAILFAAPESPELDAVLQQLQEALHEHISRLRKRATQIGKPERRMKD